MFRIEFFVDDKKIGSALLALVGIAHGVPNVQPVVNAEKTKRNGGLKAVTNGSAIERLEYAIKPLKVGTEMDGKAFRAVLKEAGLKASSSNHYSNAAVKAGLIKKTGKTFGRRYVVL